MTIDTINEAESTVNRELVPEGQRGDLVAALFGIAFPMQLEPCVFGVASELSPGYRGGYWHFYALGNGGFYMAPDDDATFSVACANGYAGAMSAEALGVTACLYAYSRLSFAAGGDIAAVYARQYHLLRDYAMGHAEASAIFGATD